MSKKLRKLKPASEYEDAVFYGRGDIDNLINDMANALNAAIDRINELESQVGDIENSFYRHMQDEHKEYLDKELYAKVHYALDGKKDE